MRSVLPKATVLFALASACATEEMDPNAQCDPSITVCLLGAGGSTPGSGGSDSAGSGGDMSAAGTFGTFSGGASGATGSGGLFGSGGGFGSGGSAGTGGSDAGSGGTGTAGTGGTSGGTGGTGGTGGAGGSAGKGGTAGKGGAGGSGGAPVGNCPARPWTATASQFSNVCTDPLYGLCNPPAYAVDTNASSRFSTGKQQAGDEWLQVDFGEPVTLTQVSFFTSNAGDYGRHLQIRISDTPLNHAAVPVWESPGAASLTANFSATTGQYLLVSQTGTLMMGETAWWSLHTLDVVCQ